MSNISKKTPIEELEEVYKWFNNALDELGRDLENMTEEQFYKIFGPNCDI